VPVPSLFSFLLWGVCLLVLVLVVALGGAVTAQPHLLVVVVSPALLTAVGEVAVEFLALRALVPVGLLVLALALVRAGELGLGLGWALTARRAPHLVKPLAVVIGGDGLVKLEGLVAVHTAGGVDALVVVLVVVLGPPGGEEHRQNIPV